MSEAEGHKIRVKLVEVTPAMAKQWLEESNLHNRRVRPSKVARYARDMRNGRWHLSHQGIAFNGAGRLVDGQHRLEAVIESGCVVKMLVFTKVDMTSQSFIDTHVSRDSVDRLTLTGKFGEVTKLETGTLKRMLKGMGRWPQLSCMEEEELFAKHRAAIRFAIKAFPGKRKRITISPVYAAVARAYYSQDKQDLARFCYVLLTGEVRDEREKICVRLRDYLTLGDTKDENPSPESKYRKTCSALKMFLGGVGKSRKIYPIMREEFLLPGEERVKEKVFSKRRFDAYDRALSFIRVRGESTSVEMMKNLRMSYNTLYRILEHLTSEGLIKKVREHAGRAPAIWRYVGDAK